MKRILTASTIALSVMVLMAFFAVSPRSAKAETIKVGAILAETGPSFLGVPEANTLRMLAEELNAKGGVNGNKVELVIKDSGGKPENAVSFAKQLIEEDKVFAIIGPRYRQSGGQVGIQNPADGQRCGQKNLYGDEQNGHLQNRRSGRQYWFRKGR